MHVLEARFLLSGKWRKIRDTNQLCIVHMVRNSLSYVSYKDRKAVAADLRLVYTASTEVQAEQYLVELAKEWVIAQPRQIGSCSPFFNHFRFLSS